MNFRPILQKLYPEGSYGGQCAVFTEKLTDHPLVGKTIASKRAAIAKYGINRSMMGPLQVGDVVITSDGLVGHTFLVNSKPTPSMSMATESNWYLNLRVHHSRLVSDNDPHIIGVFRGRKLKFPVPEEPPQYNIPLRIKIVMNNQPEWASMTKHAFNLTSWFYKYSGGHILPVVDWVYVNLDNIETVYQPDGLGSNTVKIVKETWFNDHILPLAQGFDVVMFCMPKKDWTDSILNNPSEIELGFCYRYIDSQPNLRPKLPMKILIALDEMDDYPVYYDSIGGFGKYMMHELMHGLYGICLKDSIGVGFDFTHRNLKGENGYPINPQACFNDFDYQKLANLLKH